MGSTGGPARRSARRRSRTSSPRAKPSRTSPRARCRTCARGNALSPRPRFRTGREARRLRSARVPRMPSARRRWRTVPGRARPTKACRPRPSTAPVIEGRPPRRAARVAPRTRGRARRPPSVGRHDTGCVSACLRMPTCALHRSTCRETCRRRSCSRPTLGDPSVAPPPNTGPWPAPVGPRGHLRRAIGARLAERARAGLQYVRRSAFTIGRYSAFHAFCFTIWRAPSRVSEGRWFTPSFCAWRITRAATSRLTARSSSTGG